MSHTRTTLSSPPDTASLWSGLNSAERTQFEWPESVHWNFWDLTDQILTVLSSEAVSKNCPSWEKETERTVPEWALMTEDFPSTVGSHSLTVRSFDPEARSPVWGEKSREQTASLCPANL